MYVFTPYACTMIVLNWVLSLDELPANNINIPPLETSYAPAEKLAGFNFV